MMERISGVYKITNKITGEFYIGSSQNIMHRWIDHKSPSTWNNSSGMLIYQAFQEYGLENFDFEIIEETDDLKNREQYFIDLLKPGYNIRVATSGLTRKEYQKQYYKSEKGKEVNRKYQLSEKRKVANRKSVAKYQRSEKGKEANKKHVAKYMNRLCEYNGETLTLNALRFRLKKAGIEHPIIEAKKYILS